ncbi:AraC family transcriptional regulator [Sphingomonas sp.]|uniref:helix-turn-helix domain-containing protein n=1 Tax=Sphingomonas sp. TaxID=28214 RepID=UPI002DE7B9C3|nr:AraC family transcriptional regulator [Sphingomonas sp.]
MSHTHITSGLQHLEPGACIRRHRHAVGYVALLAEGGYTEAGDRGRFSVQPGEVVLHHAHEAHQDLTTRSRTLVLNLPLPDLSFTPGHYECSLGEEVLRLARTDPVAAAEAMLAGLRPAPRLVPDWPDLLAEELRSDSDLTIAEWASAHGLAPQSVSRGFRQVFGVSPKRFRAETRALRAVETLRTSRMGLADLAFSLGFADQSHLTRAVKTLTGSSPGRFARAAAPAARTVDRSRVATSASRREDPQGAVERRRADRPLRRP